MWIGSERSTLCASANEELGTLAENNPLTGYGPNFIDNYHISETTDIFCHHSQPLEFVPASRERVIPTEWQVRAFLGDCKSKAQVISIQAPQYRQHALISNFLDLANLSIQEEAALATNWIKDRPEGLKLQNLASATMTGLCAINPKIRLQMFSTPEQTRVSGIRNN